MKKYKWLLDAGHGGVDESGKYTTAPGKMFTFPDGLTFYEGVNNRAIVDKLAGELDMMGIDFAFIHDPVADTPLRERVNRANRHHRGTKQCIYLSIHSDAMPGGSHGKGSGFAVYTSPGQTASDKVADVICEMYDMELKGYRLRKDLADGDSDREENFYVLRKTLCPAVLVENLFYDNRREAEFLLSERGQEKIASTLALAMCYVEHFKVI